MRKWHLIPNEIALLIDVIDAEATCLVAVVRSDYHIHVLLHALRTKDIQE